MLSFVQLSIHMNIIRFIIVATIVLSFNSCQLRNKYKNADQYSFSDIENVIPLNGKPLDMEGAILSSPMGLQVYDSILVVLESSGEYVCQLFNLNNDRNLGYRIARGQGPNDMIMPNFINGEKDKLRFIDLASSTIFEYSITDFVHNQNPVPINKIKLSDNVDSGMLKIKNDYIGFKYFQDQQLYKYSNQGVGLGGFIPFPESTIQYSNEERADAYYMGFTSNYNDRIALCYYMTDLLEIYDIEGKLKKRLHGPEQFFLHHQYPEKNKDAYFSPQNAGEHLFVLYNGGRIKDEGHSSSCTKMFSFSWEGDLECMYELDYPIYTFFVDCKVKKIYGVCTKPDYHIVEYSY